MAESIKIKLDGSQYRLPTQEDITSAKQFILRRNDFARLLESKVEDCLEDAAQEIVRICYKYNVDPKEFSINSKYNEKMMEEISEVMDELEADIMSLIYDYSLRVTDDEKHRNLLAAWIALLGRGNNNLQDTLDGYLYKTMKDWEAAIAALRFANVAMADAVTKVKSNLHSIYTMPEVTAAFKHADDFNATYIQSHGVMAGGVGLSNNGSTNVTNMARLTLQMAWMREQGIEFDESGAAGYYQLRGSAYPCSVCDDEVGFHKGLEDLYTKPYPHPHCCCYRIPIFALEEGNADTERWNEYQRLNNDEDYYDVEYKAENGGVKATHVDHNFDENKGWYEEKVQTAGFLNGHSVILGAEYHNIYQHRNYEGLWDGMPFEIAGAESATSNNIRNALKHCAAKPDTRIAVLFFPNDNFTTQAFNDGFAKFFGLKGTSQYKQFDLIYCIHDDQIIHIKKPSD